MTDPDTPHFRIARAALETGKVAAINEEVEADILVIVQVKEDDPDDEMGATLSTLEAGEHLNMLARALQGFADITNQPIQIIRLNTGDEIGTG